LPAHNAAPVAAGPIATAAMQADKVTLGPQVSPPSSTVAAVPQPQVIQPPRQQSFQVDLSQAAGEGAAVLLPVAIVIGCSLAVVAVCAVTSCEDTLQHSS
jgi:hypothetical protein